MSGNVFNIMRYSIHDGPGIRTTVFLKGCPLNCWWCHNPESQSYQQELIVWKDRCINCGKCVKVCPTEALALVNGQITAILDKCNVCGKCTDVCNTEAIEIVGKERSVEQVMEDIEKDLIFYDESGGGATFSGGEPLSQQHFLKKLLIQCKDKEIHTAVETTGYTKFENIQEIADYVDLFLYDVKLIDSNKHKKYTGVANDIILANLRKLSSIHNKIIVRIPIIPGVNDDDDNISKIGEFILSLKSVREVHLLPYHKAGVEKYKRLNREYKLQDTLTPDDLKVNELAKKLQQFGLITKIGG